MYLMTLCRPTQDRFMRIDPKIRGFICTTAHPAGCEQAVLHEIDYAKKHGKCPGPRNVLVIGASTGYGLCQRIAAAFGWGANTIGVFLKDREMKKGLPPPAGTTTPPLKNTRMRQVNTPKASMAMHFLMKIRQQTAA